MRADRVDDGNRISRLSLHKQAALLAFAFCFLYLPFRSIDYDPNGIVEAANLEAGFLFSPNHMIYRPIGNGLYRVVEALGYTDRSIHVLQILNALCGACGVGLAFSAFRKLGVSGWAAFAASTLWGTCFIYWYFGIDVSYIMMAGMFVAAALLCAITLRERTSRTIAICLGLTAALATLSWQASVFLFPVVLWPLRRRLAEAGLALTTAILILLGTYLLAGISEGHSRPADLVRWATNYAGGNLPEWGKFEAARISSAAEYAVRSIQFDAFERIREFLELPRPHRLRISAGSISLVLLGLATLGLGIRQAVRGDSRLTWMIGGYLILWPFIIWWSPGESKWFLVPNVFLFAACAVVWDSSVTRRSLRFLVFAAIAIMAYKTFSSWVWLKHTQAGESMGKASCVAQNLRPQDRVIAGDWTWTAQASYFHGVDALSIIDHAGALSNREKLLTYINEEVARVRNGGGRVFIVDPASYTEQHLQWLAEQTSFTSADFEQFPGRAAFQCEDARFREVTR